MSMQFSGISTSDVKEADIKGGLKIVGDDFEYDLTFEKVLEGLREREEIEVANILLNSKNE